jgi:hypothetical protein
MSLAAVSTNLVIVVIVVGVVQASARFRDGREASRMSESTE